MERKESYDDYKSGFYIPDSTKEFKLYNHGYMNFGQEIFRSEVYGLDIDFQLVSGETAVLLFPGGGLPTEESDVGNAYYGNIEFDVYFVNKPKEETIESEEIEQEETATSEDVAKGGIKAALEQDPATMEISVREVYEGPAKGKLEPGDVIIAVNDQNVEDMDIVEVVNGIIIGNVGEGVKFTVRRPGVEGELEYVIIRVEIDN